MVELSYVEIAQSALDAVNGAYADALQEVGLDIAGGPFAEYEPETDMYLYVYADGSWVIDHPDYLQDHKTVTQVPIGGYETAEDLAAELELWTDWDALEFYGEEAS
jgi:hypothetical protein